jgi:hypothetical protein
VSLTVSLRKALAELKVSFTTLSGIKEHYKSASDLLKSILAWYHEIATAILFVTQLPSFKAQNARIGIRLIILQN